MNEVWLYASDRERTGELSAELAELGYTPLYLGTGDPLIPVLRDRALPRRPTLAVVVGSADQSQTAVVERIAAAEEFVEVGVLVVLEPEQVRSFAGLRAANELLVVPYSLDELEVRVARAARDTQAAEGGTIVRAGPLELNLQTYQVANAGKLISFTYMEYELLKFLVTHPNRVFSREALLKQVWGYDYFGGARTVDVHVRRVRAKLGPEQAARLKTIRSVGYLFALSELGSAAA